jgi:Domain of unknown function (DUF4157)
MPDTSRSGAVLAPRKPLARPSQIPVASVGKDDVDVSRCISPVLEVVGKTGGQPLDPKARADMENRLGFDFSDVRIHTGDEAAKSAGAISAKAYTVGNEVVFGHGYFQPTSPAGRHRLAHELVHVQQLRKEPVSAIDRTGIAISDPSDSVEQEAEATATRVMSSPEPVARSDLHLSDPHDQFEQREPESTARELVQEKTPEIQMLPTHRLLSVQRQASGDDGGQYPFEAAGLTMGPTNSSAKITSDTTGQDGTRIVVFDNGEKITVSPDGSTTTGYRADGTVEASSTTGPAAAVP